MCRIMLDVSGDYLTSTIRARESAREFYEAAIKAQRRDELNRKIERARAAYFKAWRKLVAKDKRDWV